jgi:hypothetical protein
MDRNTEERWVKALERKGVKLVRAELDLTAGRPEDVVFDVGDAPPYPTRAFCAAWCNGLGSRRLRPQTYAGILATLAALFVVCIIQTADDWPQPGAHAGFAAAAPPLGPPPPSDDEIGNVNAISPADPSGLLPDCSWVSAGIAVHTVRTRPACAKLGSGGAAGRDAAGAGAASHG